MTVEAGTLLGPYEIVAPIGAGGMGEVYRARDTRLDRQVAVKLLPSHLSSSSDFKLRFEREARVISSFNHPNICTLHDVGEKDGLGFLVMEYCEGESLASRLARGPLPLEQVLRIGTEIASALDRAHHGGIVHRDLKPGNIMLTKGGAKLLDFGLAKPSVAIGSGAHPSGPSLMDGATEQKPLTAEGAIVGTFQYMAPEQLEGSDADARSDIFAFGAILYEMTTGRRAFEGKTKASLIASILDRQPQPISEIQPLAPPALERVIRTAMAKDPDDRWQTAHDLLLELRWIAEGGSQVGLAAPVVARRKMRERVAWGLAAVALVAASTVGALLLRKAPPPRTLRTQINPPAGAPFRFEISDCGSLTISPDGRRVTFAAAGDDGVTRLWVRPLESLEAKAIAGTESGQFPFWSPDSRFIAFFADGKLKKIDPDGGPALSICDVEINPRSGSWSRDGVIIFSPSSVTSVHRVADSGGKPTPVTSLDAAAGETTHRWASFLPDQKHFLYLVGAHSAGTRSEKNAIYIGSIDGKTRKLLFYARSNVHYAAGHLLWVRDGAIVAQRFDADAMKLEGDPIPVASSVRYTAGFFHGTFSVSDEGTLVYTSVAPDQRVPLAWFDRSGRKISSLGGPELWAEAELSPDGKHLAAVLEDPAVGTLDIWIYDLERGSRSKFAFSPVSEYSPRWSPDGRTIVFARDLERNNWSDLYLKPAFGGGEEQLLLASEATKFPTGWSPDGKYIAFDSFTTDRLKPDIWLLPLSGDRKPVPFLRGDASESGLKISPDGKWASYTSDETGTVQVTVTSFPEKQGRSVIGTGNATASKWSRGGRELLYGTGAGELYAVEVTGDASRFETGVPQLLFKSRSLLTGVGDISADGERALLLDLPPESQSAPITVVTNWAAVLER
ncbi:MAG: protein kinase [Acidobacteria bacterium]|nr:protein kinase [Acidobacteriota bacterium]